MTTESEMKKKWCPEALVSDIGGSINRSREGEVPSACLCLGSFCAQWAWDMEHIKIEETGYVRSVDGPSNIKRKSTTDGHCGRVGKLK